MIWSLGNLTCVAHKILIPKQQILKNLEALPGEQVKILSENG